MAPALLRWPLRLATALAFVGFSATVSIGCIGLDSGLEYPDVSGVDLDNYLVTPEGDDDPSVGLDRFKISPKTCEGIDMHVITGQIDQEDLTRYFAAQQITLEPRKARDNLYWFEIPVSSDPEDGSLRLRLAILPDRQTAAKDLHDALLEHGPGWWGVRRGNVALLAPKAGLKDALRFAIKYKLVCWGMFTYAGVDDAYGVVGGYSDF